MFLVVVQPADQVGPFGESAVVQIVENNHGQQFGVPDGGLVEGEPIPAIRPHRRGSRPAVSRSITTPRLLRSPVVAVVCLGYRHVTAVFGDCQLVSDCGGVCVRAASNFNTATASGRHRDV